MRVVSAVYSLAMPPPLPHGDSETTGGALATTGAGAGAAGAVLDPLLLLLLLPPLLAGGGGDDLAAAGGSLLVHTGSWPAVVCVFCGVSERERLGPPVPTASAVATAASSSRSCTTMIYRDPMGFVKM